MVLVPSQALLDIYQKIPTFAGIQFRIFFNLLFFLGIILYRSSRGHAGSLCERQHELKEDFTPALASWDSCVFMGKQLERCLAKFENKSKTSVKMRGRVEFHTH